MVKKLLLKVFMYGFVFFGLSLYASYLMTGRLPSFATNFSSFLSAPRVQAGAQPNWSDIGKLEHKKNGENGDYEVVQGGKTVIYKWKDANGRWQYGERAPATGSATRIEIATPPPSDTSSSSTGTNEDKKPRLKTERPELSNPYSPEGVKEIMDKAHEVQRAMNQRNEQLEQGERH